MNIFTRRQRSADAPARIEPRITAERKPFRVTESTLSAFRAPATAPTFATRADVFRPREPAPGVLPKGTVLAQDGALDATLAWASEGAYGERISFVGYQYLAELAQLPEYRRISETIAKEMTRKWIALQATGDGDKSDKIKALNAAMDRYRVQDMFRLAAEHDGLFGVGHLYIDTGATDDPAELAVPLSRTPAKIGRDALKGLRIVEPLWVYPDGYNSTDPLKPDFYDPQTWWVMGKRVHASRLLTFVGREVPDIMKPAYMFGGMSLSQMAMPYVNNWIRTRQSVSDLLHSFSVSGIRTDMAATLNDGGGAQMNMRAQLFNMVRDNRGLMMLDKDTEEFFNIAVPLGTLDHLQAQAQEHMASVSGIPLVKLLGITPSGLNATSDGEIRTFYDWVQAQQEHLFNANLKRVIEIIQLSEFGEIDTSITHKFEPLWQLDEAGIAAVEKTKADTHEVYVNLGVVAPDEVRASLAADEESSYHGLDMSGPAPGVPETGADPDDPETNSIERQGEEGSETGANSGV